MSNPFYDDAMRMIQKRDRWDKLTTAKAWLEACYQPGEAEISVKQFEGSGLRGSSEAMSCLSEMIPAPSKSDALDWIDRQLKDLKAEA